MIKLVNTKKGFIVTTIIIFIVILLMNFLTPVMADDFSYIYQTKNLANIFTAEYHQYMDWTGRSVAHIIARFFLMFPKFIFNFANTSVYIFAVFLVYKISNVNKDAYLTTKFILCNILAFLFLPFFGETVLWETGSANYLWCSTLMLCFIYVYHSVIFMDKSNPVIPTILVPLLGIISGWCNENTSGGTLIIILLYICTHKFVKKKKIDIWMISGLFGQIIGMLFLLLAPGNNVRAQYFERNNWSLLKKAFLGLRDVSKTLQHNCYVLILICFVVIILCYYFYNNNYRTLISSIYLFSGLCTLYALILSPAGLNWSRSYFGGVLFIIIALLSSIPPISEKSKIDNTLSKSALAIFWMYAIVTFIIQLPIAVVDISKSYLLISEQYHHIETQKSKGNLHPIVREFNFTPETNYPAYSPRLSHLTGDINSKYNIPMADYFNVETIRSVPEKLWYEKYKLK